MKPTNSQILCHQVLQLRALQVIRFYNSKLSRLWQEKHKEHKPQSEQKLSVFLVLSSNCLKQKYKSTILFTNIISHHLLDFNLLSWTPSGPNPQNALVLALSCLNSPQLRNTAKPQRTQKCCFATVDTRCCNLTYHCSCCMSWRTY
jgi:hypothetical protein